MGVHLPSLIRFSNVRHMLCLLAGELGPGRKKKNHICLPPTQQSNLSTSEDFFFLLIPIELSAEVKKCAAWIYVRKNTLIRKIKI